MAGAVEIPRNEHEPSQEAVGRFMGCSFIVHGALGMLIGDALFTEEENWNWETPPTADLPTDGGMVRAVTSDSGMDMSARTNPIELRQPIA
jgi:hypothetical protein